MVLGLLGEGFPLNLSSCISPPQAGRSDVLLRPGSGLHSLELGGWGLEQLGGANQEGMPFFSHGQWRAIWGFHVGFSIQNGVDHVEKLPLQANKTYAKIRVEGQWVASFVV